MTIVTTRPITVEINTNATTAKAMTVTMPQIERLLTAWSVIACVCTRRRYLR